MYQFLLNMWVMRRINETYLQARVSKGQIAKEEYETIIATLQVIEQ